MNPPAASPSTIRLGVLGCGTVGSAFVHLVAAQRDSIEARTGLRLEIGRVAVRDPSADPDFELVPGVLTYDAAAVATDSSVDVVVELIGGIEPARALIEAAIGAGKPVITANKALLAVEGAGLFAAAEDHGVDLLFEAAVGGGIPIMRPLRESLAGDRIVRVLGIVNGTTNFVLTRMADDGATFAEALAEAQRLGYAESDPTADVEGLDAAAKAAILASISFGVNVTAADVFCEGVSALQPEDLAFAGRSGQVVKLLAVAERAGAGGDEVAVRVHPALLPASHPLAGVRDSYNAVFVEGQAVGQLMFYGRGAGGEPTASAVLGDVIDASLNLRRASHASVGRLAPATISPISELRCPYYLSLEAEDRTGVLRTVAEVFERHGVSIRSMEQDDLGASGARLVFITHTAREASVQATVAELRDLPVVKRVGSLLRIVAGDDQAGP